MIKKRISILTFCDVIHDYSTQVKKTDRKSQIDIVYIRYLEEYMV